MYGPLLFNSDGSRIGKSHISEKEKCITFPSGAKTYFSYLEFDKHADSWYGLELAKIYFEEIQFRTWYQFNTLRSRNRTMAKVTKGIRATCNPDPTHFSCQFASIFLDENMYPIKELSGKTAYYIIVDNELKVSWDKEKLLEDYPGFSPLTYTYIPATIDDNKFLLDNDKSYRDTLNSLPEIKRKQLLLGCWESVENTGMYFQRDWLRKVTHVPVGSKYCRGWDTASSIPDVNSGYIPDWTVGVKMAKCKDGNYYLCGMERFQERPAPRDSKIISTGHRDGVDCDVIVGKDVGSAGNFQFQEFAKKASDEGLICKADPMPNNKSKLTRFEPFSVACQNGFVHIVESSFTPEQLKQLYAELERFNGDRSNANRGWFDDIADAAASAFNYLASERQIRMIKRNQLQSPSLASDIRDSINK